MQNFTDKKIYKTVIINRAVSGSGKTTLSRCVTDTLRKEGLSVAIHSTDDFFMRDGRYVFDIDKLNAYHAQNLSNFVDDLKRGLDVVICDNMNLLPWQSQPYTNMARKYNYRIIFLNFLPRELEKHMAAQIVTEEKPDAHGLSKELLERFIKNFYDYNDLLDKNTVRDIKRHRVFVWNDVDKVAMDTGVLAQYFDSDVVITIKPEEYHILKETLPGTVLNLITASDLKRRDAKKHVLLTWYGMTDLRAALGFEPSDGPVLGALRTGFYTDVIILGYTNPNKSSETLSGELRKEWDTLRLEPLEIRLAYPRAKAQTIVDAVCNTEYAHELFLEFLKKAKLSVGIHFQSQILSSLNDVRSIDAGARKALRMALSDKEEKDIACFLSPGTPLMAYTWAMLTRSNPNLHLKVITSSNPQNPPEEVDLPKDIITPPVFLGDTHLQTDFDILIHLLGTDTNIPQYFSIVQFPAKKHWFITSADSKKVNDLGRILPQGATMNTKIVDAFVPFHTRKAIEEIVSQLPSSTRIGVNLTGGTKLMFAGALNACNEFINVEPFYFDIKQNNITFLRTGLNMPFKGVSTIDGFFKLSGCDIITQGHWEDNPIRGARRNLTLDLWRKRKFLGKMYRNKGFRSYEYTRNKPNPPFSFKGNSYNCEFDGRKANVSLDGKSLRVPDCSDFGEYIGGGWLEEFAYLQLLPLLDAGKIFDLRIGMEVSLADQLRSDEKNPLGEFDCAFTDGNRLFIVECKAGSVKQEHIQKLENNLKFYGGNAAKGILFSSFPLNDIHQKRISVSTSITAISGNDICTRALQRIVV